MTAFQQLRILGVARSALRPGEIGVDLFAGGGGWSEGFQRATGVPPAVAVNHDKDAIAMHSANHPESEHLQEDVFTVDPLTATRGRAVGWLHASPDCRHFSRAKGSAPKTAGALSKRIRGLAWVVVQWAKAVRPRIISLENVGEFVTWGPLHQQGPKAGTANKRQAGTTFRKFIGALQALGYVVEWRVLNAADFGAPTSRKRLFVIARRDGRRIVWPTPTHGPKGALPYRTAAECIDWSIPAPSIFDRKKPLADATLRRIAEGIRRFVLDNPKPFIVNLTHGGRLESIDEPMQTVTAAHRGEKAIIVPTLVANNTNNAPQSVEDPLGTITSGNRHYAVAPTLIQTGYGERAGQKPRALNMEAPLGTVVGGGQKHAMVAAMLKHYGGVVGHTMEQPLGTITSWDHHSLLAVHVESMYSNSTGSGADQPLPTITAQSNHHGIVAASLAKYYGRDEHGQTVTEPMHTIPTKDRFALVAAFLSRYHGERRPGEKGRVESVEDPLPTQSTENRFGVVTVIIEGETYAIADIGMRMLQPRELARAQGFPDSYILTGTKSSQVARIGNSVPPAFPEAIVAANLDDDVEVAA